MNLLIHVRRRLSALGLMVVAMVAMAVPAFATTESAGVTAVNSAVSDAAGDASSVVTTNIPVILGVVLLFVILKYGKRILGKL